MKTTALLAMALCLSGVLFGQTVDPEWEVTQRRGVRFVPLDIVFDSGGRALAAYQCTLEIKKGDVRIVGIEGGEHPAFQRPPYYDPRAMQRQKVVLAAFDTGKSLPRGRTRVATVHLEVRGKTEPKFTLEVETAAGPEGQAITVETQYEQRRSK